MSSVRFRRARTPTPSRPQQPHPHPPRVTPTVRVIFPALDADQRAQVAQYLAFVEAEEAVAAIKASELLPSAVGTIGGGGSAVSPRVAARGGLPSGTVEAAAKLSPPRLQAWQTMTASRASRSPPRAKTVTLSLDVK